MNEQRRRKARALKGHSVTSLFVFFLIGLFALLAVTLTFIGMRAYRSLSEASVGNSEGQIALSYLLSKVRASDRAGGVRLEEHDGLTVLCLNEDIDGEAYETRIYYDAGALREYFCEAGEPFDSELGEALCDLKALEVSLQTPRLLYVEAVQKDGRRQRLHIALRGGEAMP